MLFAATLRHVAFSECTRLVSCPYVFEHQCFSLLGLLFPGFLPETFLCYLKYLAQKGPLLLVHLRWQSPLCLQVLGTHFT